MIATIAAAIAWISANWVAIAAIAGGLVTLASAIVKLTPTQKDDRAVGKVVRVLELVSMAKRRPAVVRHDVDAEAVDELMAALEETWPGQQQGERIAKVAEQLRAPSPLTERL